MGCASSLSKDVINEWKNNNGGNYHSRETRIIQEEEVDVFIDDEYDVIDNYWNDVTEDYQVVEEKGSWIKDISSGGSRNDLEKFSTNPQFSLNIGTPEMVAESLKVDPYIAYFQDNQEEKKVKITVSLTQETPNLLHVAFFIYKKETWPGERLSAEFFLVVQPEGDTGAFVNWRQIKHEYSLLPGAYILVAAPFQPGTEGSFNITVRGPTPFTFKTISQENF